MAAAVDKRAIATRIDGIISVGIVRSLKVVEEFEVTFTTPITEKLSNLKMREIVRRKNPYLYRASGVSTCEELVNRAFTEYTSTLARIHRRRASGQCPEVARGCSCESGIMVLKQQSRPQNKEHPIDATTQPSRSHPNRV